MKYTSSIVDYCYRASSNPTGYQISRDDMSDMIDPRLRHPFTSIVAGPTMCGKTEFCRRLIQGDSITPKIDNVIWCYSEWQPTYEVLKDRVHFVEGLISSDELDPNKTNLVVIDDLMDKKDAGIETFFTRSCHHRNTSCVYIVQNIFNQNKGHRTCSLNAHYIFLFKNPRDTSQVKVLARQMFPGNVRYLTDSFADATKIPYGYLCIDMKPETAEYLRLRSDILNPSSQIVYVPNEYKYKYKFLQENSTDHTKASDEEDGAPTQTA